MKNLLLVSTMLIASISLVSAQYPEKSELFHGSYSEDYVMRWHFQNLCQHSFDPRTNPFMWPSKPNGVSFNPADVKAGDLIFVRDVGTFFKTLHPSISRALRYGNGRRISRPSARKVSENIWMIKILLLGLVCMPVRKHIRNFTKFR